MNTTSRRCLALLLLLAFLLRLAAAVYWHRTAEAEGRLFRLGDSHSYWTLASQLARGQAYQYGSDQAQIFRAPLYPLLLAPFALVQDERHAVWWARVFGCGLGTLAVGLLALLAARMGGPCAGLWAAAIGAVYPSAIGMSVAILSEVVLLPGMLAYLLAWQTAWRARDHRQAAWWAILAGGVSGATVLARPSWLLFIPFAFAAGVVLGGRRGRHTVLFFGSMIGLCLVMSPWWVRNARITGRFVPTTLQVGPSLYDGLHAGATGASDEGMAFMTKLVEEQQRADSLHSSRDQLTGTFEYRVNARAQAAAVQWAITHPSEVIRLAGRKFMRTWSLWPDGGDVGSYPLRLAITLSTMGVLVLASGASWFLFRPFDWWHGICWLPCLYFTLLHMVFVGSVRYREPGVFALVALASCAMATLLHCPWEPSSSAKQIEKREQGSASFSRA